MKSSDQTGRIRHFPELIIAAPFLPIKERRADASGEARGVFPMHKIPATTSAWMTGAGQEQTFVLAAYPVGTS